jgi:hypothetical protein
VWLDKRAERYVAVLEPGFVYAFDICMFVSYHEETITEDSDLYLILEIDFELNVINSHRSLIVKRGRQVDYLYKMPAEDSSRYEYAYKIATVYNSEKAENATPNWLVHQHQLGDIILPFRADYVPEIDPSLAPLIAIDENVKAPFVNLKLQDKIEKGAPKEESDVFLNQKSGVLRWGEVPADVKVHESLANLIAVNEDGELALPLDNVKPGQVLTVSADGVAVEWSVASGGGGSAALGVITVAGANDGYGTAKWKPVVLASDGTYTVDGSASEQTVIIPRA